MLKFNLFFAIIFSSFFVFNSFGMKKESKSIANNIKISKHAKLRMTQRGFSEADITQVLNNNRFFVTNEKRLKHMHNNMIVITDNLMNHIVTVFKNDHKSNAWQTLSHNEREKIKLQLRRLNYYGDDFIRYYYKLCKKSRDLAISRARDIKQSKYI